MQDITSKKILIQNNIALANIFRQMADCYHYLGKEERFRAIAYDSVVKTLHNMKDDIALYAKDIKTLDEIAGIGESIAEKISEYLHKGKIEAFEQLKKRVPFELLELMDINGIGPATLKQLHDQLNINSKEDLENALLSGKVAAVKGFGGKKIENLQQALKIPATKKRMPLKDAENTGYKILDEIKAIPGVGKAALAGSLRRKKETIGDIDIIIEAIPEQRHTIVSRFITLPGVKKVLVKGSKKASVLLKDKDVQVDIRLVNDYEYGAALLYFTGSKEHNIKLRIIARKLGYKLNEYGMFDLVSSKRIAGATEEEIYKLLDLKFIPPEQRLDKGEIEKAALKQNSVAG
jgi:DNA polymerase (family X)